MAEFSKSAAQSFEDEIVERSSNLRCGVCHNRMTRSQLQVFGPVGSEADILCRWLRLSRGALMRV